MQHLGCNIVFMQEDNLKNIYTQDCLDNDTLHWGRMSVLILSDEPLLVYCQSVLQIPAPSKALQLAS